jgi:hypothetical protein
MRRLLAISLLLLFSLPLISPLFALTANVDGHLPACCRRNGAHHCAKTVQDEQSQGIRLSAVREKCPAYPQAIAPLRRNDLSLHASAPLSIRLAVSSADEASEHARAWIELDHSMQERGPPLLSLA